MFTRIIMCECACQWVISLNLEFPNPPFIYWHAARYDRTHTYILRSCMVQCLHILPCFTFHVKLFLFYVLIGSWMYISVFELELWPWALGDWTSFHCYWLYDVYDVVDCFSPIYRRKTLTNISLKFSNTWHAINLRERG